jgi:hypothetical protein
LILLKVSCSHSFLCLQHFYLFFGWIFSTHYGFSCTRNFFSAGFDTDWYSRLCF